MGRVLSFLPRVGIFCTLAPSSLESPLKEMPSTPVHEVHVEVEKIATLKSVPPQELGQAAHEWKSGRHERIIWAWSGNTISLRMTTL